MGHFVEQISNVAISGVAVGGITDVTALSC
jgi:hypothetical protein